MAEAAKKSNPAQQEQQIAADIPPSKPEAAPAQNYEQCVAQREARGILTADIACDTRRLANATTLGSVLDTTDILQKNPKAKTSYSDYDLAIRVMKDSARKGQIGDPFVGELAKRGVSRVRFKEENGQIVRDKDGNPIIESDRVRNIAAQIVGTAIDKPDAKQFDMGKGIEPLAMNKTRVCIAAFADVNMRLEKTVETEGQPKETTNNIVAKLTELDRKVEPDTVLESRVKEHLANKSTTKKMADVVQDCGFMALRQLHDEGFRYQGQQMVVPPTRSPLASNDNGSPAAKSSIKR